MDRDGNNKKTVLSYAAYDWAASPLPTLHATFVFAVYFTTVIMPEGGTVAWAWMTALAGIAVAVIAPFSGIIADRYGWRKKSLFVLTLMAIVAGALLWLVQPDSRFIALALGLSAVLIFATELSFVFYNALLPKVANAKTIGRVSGLAWGFGYIGAILSLGLVLGVLILPEMPPFGLDADRAEHIRITMPLAALWLALFVLPFFLYVPEGKPDPAAQNLRQTWRLIRHTPGMLRFLITRMIYADGLVTLFAFGGIFAANVFGLNQTDVLIFAIVTNLTAGIGAIIGGWADDHFGAIKTIRASLVALIIIGAAIMLATDPFIFWAMGSLLGFFIGPLQSASRSHLARIAPKDKEAQVFSFMMLTGKSTAFVGPFLYGVVVLITGQDRFGMAVVLALLIGGLLLLRPAPKQV